MTHRSNHSRFAATSRFALTASLLAFGLAAMPADAQENAESAPDQDIVVNGSRPIKESEQAALKTQKESLSLVSVISSDSVGRLPDQNIAQAISRLPGIAVQRDQGQARYINIRGAPLNWTTLSFDGINIISPEGRDARFDSIPSAIAAQIVVRKAVTPDLTAETIAGNINVVTRSAFDYDGFHAAFKLGGGYVDLGGGAEFEGTGVISNRWDTSIGEIGIVASGTYYQRKMATDNFETDWETVPADRRPLAAGETDPRVWARETENKLYRLTRKNLSSSVRLDWRPDDHNRFFGTTIYTAFVDDELRWNSIYDFDDQEGRVPNATTACTTNVLTPNTTGYADVCSGNTPYLGTVYGIDINHNSLSRRFQQSVFINTIGGDHSFDRWTVSWRGNYTQSKDDRSAPAQLNYDSPGFGTNGATAINRPTVFYDLRDEQLARVELYRTLRAADGTLSRGARVQQIEDFPLTLTRVRSLEAIDTTNAYTGRIDVARQTELFGDTKFAVGFQYDNRTKTVDESLFDTNSQLAFNPATGVTSNTAATINNVLASGVSPNIAAINIPDPYLGQLPLGFNFRYFSEAAIRDIATRATAFGAFVPSVANYYKVREEVISGYVMGTSRFDWGSVVYGVRVESVRNVGEAFRQTTTAATPGNPSRVVVTPVSASSDFVAAYPSIHANWDVTSEHKFRLSFNTGASRPDYTVARPNVILNDTNQTVSAGNPNARPERTRGVDLYWEYYRRGGGFISVGAFYKSVNDVLFTFNSQVDRTTLFNFFGTPVPAGYNGSQVVNGGSGEIYGVEGAFQMRIDDLVDTNSWLGGFGIQTNGVINRSSAVTPDGRTVRLPGASDYVLNVGPYYEKYGLSIRASYQYRSDWIDGIGEPAVGGDFYWAADDELDISARYAITRNFEVYADFSNILNGPGRRYAGISARTIERETFGRRYSGGIRLTF